MAAHDFIKDSLGVEEETGEMMGGLNYQIVMMLVGGGLLICSFIAELMSDRWYGSSSGVVSDQVAFMGMAAALILGLPLVVVAVKDLLKGHSHFNELVALAVLAAFVNGSYQEAAAIAFFMIISVLIETRTALGARQSIESLVKITPTKAHLLFEGEESEVEAATLKAGDLVRVRPGDNIPADGEIVSGNSTVDQAHITGESVPAEKEAGDFVFGGTINVTGVMDIRVTKAGDETTLGRVKELILQAESTRIPIARMIDRYSAWYSPTILMLVGLVWFLGDKSTPGLAAEAANRAVTMLVVACPCAIILATPTAMVAGLSAASRLGVLVKSVLDMEAARHLTAIVFDKTGTLTTGMLEVSRLSPEGEISGGELLSVAASVEVNSKHPVARAVVKVAKRAGIVFPDVGDFEEVPGKGVRGLVKGCLVSVGRASWLIDEADCGLGAEGIERVGGIHESQDADGLSVLFVVRDGVLLGWIGLADNTREEAAGAMDELRELGLKRLIIVTGDRESVAKRVASQMHTEYLAEVLPEQKLAVVDELKEAGHRVAVIGDGVNDAPALAAGDISIAMGAAGSDVAIHSASVALMNNNLNRIPFLIRLSRLTSRVIKQNLFFGAGFIVLFMVLGATGSLTAIWAAILHVVSGLVVIFNSARLVRAGEDVEAADARMLALSQSKSGKRKGGGS